MIPLVNVESRASVDRFETAIAALHSAPGAVATNSGTSALHLALMALRVGSESVVAMPSLSCTALLNAVRLTGAKVELLDNDFKPEQMQFNLNHDSTFDMTLKHSKTGHLVLIAPFMFGVVPAVRCSRYDSIIEDRAMALGSTAPLVGDCAVHSFHASKIISTGEGGMVVARTPELLAKLRDLNGYSDAVVADRMNDAPEYVQRVNYRISNETCRFGNDVLTAELSWSLKRRWHIFNFYNAALDLGMDLPAGSVPGRFVFDLEGRMAPQDFIGKMAEKGVEAGRGCFPPLHRYLKLPGWEHSNAELAGSRLASLPIYAQLWGSKVEQVAEAAKAVLRR